MLKKYNERKRLMAAVLALTVVCSMLAGCTSAALPGTNDAGTQTAEVALAEVASYTVTIDINPSIELTVEDGVVTQAVAYNDDGKVLLLSTDVQGLDPDAPVAAVLQALIDGGYIDNAEEAESYLIITVSGSSSEDEDNEIADKLRDGAEDMLSGLALRCRVGTADVNQQDVEAAKALGLSVGRYLLMQYIAGVEGISLEEAIVAYGSMKIGALMEMYEGAQDLFEDGSNNGRGTFLEGLTDEQVQIVNAVIKAFKKDLQAAQKTYHDAFKQIQSRYRQTIKNMRKQYKDDAEMLKMQLEAQMQNMVEERDAALAVLEKAVNAAPAKALLAVADVPLDMEAFTVYITDIAAHEIDKEQGFHAFLKEFAAGEADEQDVEENDKQDVEDTDEQQQGQDDGDQNQSDDGNGQGQSKPKSNNGQNKNPQ